MNAFRALLVIGTALVLTGCAAAAPAAQTVAAAPVTLTVTATESVTVTKTPPPATTPPTSVVPSATTATEANLAPWGEPQLLSERKSVTVYDVQIPADITGPEPSAGLAWAAVDAEFCIPTGVAGTEISWYPWTLTAGSRMYDAESSTYNAFPKPLYPFVDAVASGECARGWIVFQAPADGTVDQVRYDASDEGGSGAQIVRWSAAA